MSAHTPKNPENRCLLSFLASLMACFSYSLFRLFVPTVRKPLIYPAEPAQHQAVGHPLPRILVAPSIQVLAQQQAQITSTGIEYLPIVGNGILAYLSAFALMLENGCTGYLAYPFLRISGKQGFSIDLVYNFLKAYASIFDLLNFFASKSSKSSSLSL